MISFSILSPLEVMGIIAKGEKPGGISPPQDINSVQAKESTYIFKSSGHPHFREITEIEIIGYGLKFV